MASSSQPPFPLAAGETVLHAGAANLQRGIENVGGRLYLTNMRLEFAPRALNVQTAPLRLPLQQVASVATGNTRVFGVPLAPNAIEVHAGPGELHRFTVNGRKSWKQSIDGALASLPR